MQDATPLAAIVLKDLEKAWQPRQMAAHRLVGHGWWNDFSK
jgi:hypothetical protein